MQLKLFSTDFRPRNSVSYCISSPIFLPSLQHHVVLHGLITRPLVLDYTGIPGACLSVCTLSQKCQNLGLVKVCIPSELMLSGLWSVSHYIASQWSTIDQ